ncbi:MAG: hypothetical protein KGL59_03085 [Acidobacteriota bacterium]|nr:hypothetical protein [Acidobacteriota bacterium]
MRSLLTITLLVSGLSGMAAQKPAASTESDHHQQVNRRGDAVMGFSHLTTTPHIRLFTNGGEIEVSANDPRDTPTRDNIRMHLEHIANMFAAGNFDAPMLIHATTPPGVPMMKKLRADIVYTFQSTARGGRVEISTRDPSALHAVHEFLRFQIADHKTGDSTKVMARQS